MSNLVTLKDKQFKPYLDENKIAFAVKNLAKKINTDLENEFPIYNVPNLKTYNPNKKVKDGQIVVSQFDGYASYELPRTTFLYLILQSFSD